MIFDIFLSICQTEVDGEMPDTQTMFRYFFDQVQLADELGFGTAWVAESHLSCEVQKGNKNPVIPHFKGEIGLNTDILQLAHLVFERTKRIHVGSAIRNILCNGGPIAHAEAVKTFLNLHRLRPNETRKLHLGFAAGRFPFANEPYGIKPRNSLEEKAWPVLRGHIFRQAAEIFLRLLRNENLSSKDITPIVLKSEEFRTKEAWQEVARAAEIDQAEELHIKSYWDFETLGVIPHLDHHKHLQLVIGSHDPKVQALANTYLPSWVFNLSITPGAKIEETHEFMSKNYNKDGGSWKREYMPRTTLLFINGDPQLSKSDQTLAAREAAVKAMRNYWQAMEGTLDPNKIEQAVENAIFGNPEEVAAAITSKYHRDDRLMLWFDFNCHDNEAIKASMRSFMQESVPLIKKELGASYES